MKTFFYMDGSDLMCEVGSETYKIAEEWIGNTIEFETLDTLKEIYGSNNLLTQEILNQGKVFASKECGYRVYG